MASKNSIFSLPKSKVAKSLLKILYSDLNDHDVDSISIILICHLMLEYRINKLLYNWLTDSIPYIGSKGDEDAIMHNKKVRKLVEDIIVKLDFAKKVALIKPLATALWKKDGEEILKEIYEVNNIRNDIFHYLKIKEAKFKGKLLSSEKGLKFFVDVTHQRLLNIDDLIELIAKKDNN